MTALAGPMGRTVVLSLCLILSAGFIARASKSEQIPLRAPLTELPFSFGGYQGVRGPDLEPNILSVLGVDEYVSRLYRSSQKTLPIGLYIGYYMSQREGDTMHSPMNCLPGSGWQPVQSGRVTVDIQGRPEEVNRYIVEKGGERLLVLYWYQGHGRIVASEYWGKIYTVIDALRVNRTGAALVRVVVPMTSSDDAVQQASETLGVEFVRTLVPLLERHLPL